MSAHPANEAAATDLKTEVEAWLDAHWDADKGCSRGHDSYDETRWLTQVVESGYAVPTWSRDWYGLGLSAREARVIEKAFKARGAKGYGRDRYHLGAITVHKLGSDALKSELLHRMLTGPICCLLYSEPGAGSDLAGVRTRAVRDGDNFVVTGQKVWTSNAEEAEFGMLLARTDMDARKHDGITFFVFPMRQDGVEIRPINQITGESEFNEVFIENARVPSRYIIGQENRGWRSFQTAIASERLIMGQGITARMAKGAGRAPALMRLAHKHDKLGDPVLRQDVAQALAYRQLNQLNMIRAKEEMMRNGASSLASLGKLAMSRIQHGEAALSARIVGPSVLLNNSEDARNANFDAAKAYMNSIGGGTDQIQRNIIAERVLGLPKSEDVSRTVPFRDIKSG